LPVSKTAPAFHVMLKPRGPICNMDCEYCYYLSKQDLYPNSRFRMKADLLELYTRQYIEAQRSPEVTFAWQGGEPTLMGLPFYRQAVEFQNKYSRPGMKISNTFQTNGLLLNDEWCRFLKEHGFLVGLSLDGPRQMHDAYRVDRTGKGTFERVMAALRLLQKHKVEYNILATLHAANAAQPLEVYRYLRDKAGAQFIQFIPIVARPDQPEKDAVRDFSITGKQYGDFLMAVFDEWVRQDVGQVFVQIFDVALAAWSGLPRGLCVFEETCGNALVMEHNGDVFSCDHFVDPAFYLGNIKEENLLDLVGLEKQQRFGQAKKEDLPRYCRECEVRFVCNGGCPKDRFLTTPDGEPGLNFLCEGYRAFFNHIRPAMDFMAAELRAQRPPANVMRGSTISRNSGTGEA
jgi:uncharacterized protein